MMTRTSTPARKTELNLPSPAKHVLALDGVRGIAILLVLMLHLLWANPEAISSWPLRMLARGVYVGWTGVDLFFVLSGLLITGILYDTLNGPHYFKNFYARRALRDFPLYYGFIFLLFVISLFTDAHWHRAIFGYLTYTNNLILAGQPLTDASWVRLDHFWTLAIEEQFYLCWPALVFFLKTPRRIATVAVGIAFCSLALRCYLQLSGIAKSDPSFYYTWTPARLDGLLMGATLAVALRSEWRSRVLKAAPIVVSVGLLMLGLYLIGHVKLDPLFDPWMNTVGIFVVDLTSCALVATVLRGGWTARAFSGSVLRFFGRYSYGIYVMHGVINIVLLKPMRALTMQYTSSETVSRLITAGAILAASVLAAALSFRFFERPILRLKRYFPNERS